MKRQEQLKTWLEQDCQMAHFEIRAIQGDASFRRYFRIIHGDQHFIAMDAPPDKEKTQPFADIDKSLQKLGLDVPHIFFHDAENGFMLLSDFGDQLFLSAITDDNADALYTKALQELVHINSEHQSPGITLPLFNDAAMRIELNNCLTWFIDKHLKLTLTPKQKECFEETFNFLIHEAESQPQAVMHRDYHCRNLMLLENGGLGILDFQDACIGPVTYDVVSLLRDAYIAWPIEFIHKKVFEFKTLLEEKNPSLTTSNETFLRWFDLMGLQRHLKVVFIFARKFHRDNDANYLKDLPRVVSYILDVIPNYPELKEFHELFTTVILPRFQACQKIAVL